MEKIGKNYLPDKRYLLKMLLTMKFIVLFLCIGVSQLFASAYSQQVTLQMENATFQQVVKELEQQTGLTFLYHVQKVNQMRRFNLEFAKADMDEVLTECLKGSGLSYRIVENTVIITPATPPQPQEKKTLKGSVKDWGGEPLPGVAVMIKGTSLGVSTDIDGKFELNMPEVKDMVLVFTFIGMKPHELTYKGQSEIHVVMEAQATEIDEVVVTGIFAKAKESYTGAATTITSADLKRAGNRNLLTSIRNIDPSFNIMDNVTMGSDPNSLPDITVRGHSSMTENVKDLQSDSKNTQSANMPLFVMDGFEITLERMMDLDDNQVESITLLKDASATAMYGTRGANGVVVITTRKPEPGKMQITYKGSINIEAPDLTSYDLLDAKEKLKYEKAAGLYLPYHAEGNPVDGGSNLQNLQDLYNSRLRDAERGVNTYWLKYPVRTGIGHKHSLRLEGGTESLLYAVGLGYNNISGAMKGSERNTFNGNIFLSYKLKNITFQNDLQISYNKSPNSPYGTFEDFAKINSYWKPYDDDGNLQMVLDDRKYQSVDVGGITNLVYNPLYNALLPSIDESKYTQIQNNFALEWSILPELFVRGRFSITSQNDRSDKYVSASHTNFLSYTGEDYSRRGEYTMGWKESFKYEADITLNYNKTFAGKHQLYAGMGYNLAEETYENYRVKAEGIPDDNSDFLGLATLYEKGGKPFGTEGISRRLGGVVNANYTYDRRYFVDLSGKIEGSSKFGSDNRFAPFWSVGAGWNLHQEAFLKENPLLNVARLRVSYGTSGSQKFDPYQAMRTFKYFGEQNYNGLSGAYLMNIGNPELGWQVTKQLNVGMEVEMFRGRVRLNADFYHKLTDDMLADITLPAAAGFDSYKANIGKVQNQGVELSVNAYVLRNTENQMSWSVGGTLAYNKSEIKEISNSLEFLNQKLTERDTINPSFLFKEGESMNTIYAVRSRGIDPSNGREIYVKADGTETYDWDPKDKVACGVEENKFWGNLNTLFRYKGWTLNAIFSYRLGGQIYNSTLAKKVENIKPIDNADRRVLYDRWIKPGDHARFKGVTDFTKTNATSRLVMDDNALECRSISLSYDLESEWLKKNLALNYLTISGYGEDLFRISSVKQERGLYYPFARKFSISLTARF